MYEGTTVLPLVNKGWRSRGRNALKTTTVDVDKADVPKSEVVKGTRVAVSLFTLNVARTNGSRSARLTRESIYNTREVLCISTKNNATHTANCMEACIC